MSTMLLMLALMGQDVEFKPTEKEAVVCKAHKVTQHIECSKPMDSRKAHEYVRGAQAGGNSEWQYIYYSLPIYRILNRKDKK